MAKEIASPLRKHCLLLFICGLSAGCPSSATEQTPEVLRQWREMASVTDEERTIRLTQFQNVSCFTSNQCFARDVCTTYLNELGKAQRLVASARKLGPTSQGGQGAATPKEFKVIVQGAEEALSNAESLHHHCEVAMKRLTATY